MNDIQRDEFQRFAVRLCVARRLLGGFLLIGVGLYLLSAGAFFGLHGWVMHLTHHWYGLIPPQVELLSLLYFTALKCLFAGVVLPLWLSALLTGRWVDRRLGAA